MDRARNLSDLGSVKLIAKSTGSSDLMVQQIRFSFTVYLSKTNGIQHSNPAY